MTIDPTRNVTRQLLERLDQAIFWSIAMRLRLSERGCRIAVNLAEAYRPEGVP